MRESEFAAMLERFALSPEGYRKVRKGVQKRIVRHMQELRCPSMKAYLERLETDGDAEREARRLMDVSISRFFRDVFFFFFFFFETNKFSHPLAGACRRCSQKGSRGRRTCPGEGRRGSTTSARSATAGLPSRRDTPFFSSSTPGRHARSQTRDHEGPAPDGHAGGTSWQRHSSWERTGAEAAVDRPSRIEDFYCPRTYIPRSFDPLCKRGRGDLMRTGRALLFEIIPRRRASGARPSGRGAPARVQALPPGVWSEPRSRASRDSAGRGAKRRSRLGLTTARIATRWLARLGYRFLQRLQSPLHFLPEL